MIADRDIRHLVEPCGDDLAKAAVETAYYDEASLAALNDTTPIPAARSASVLSSDVHALIYTSGTTGLPKGVMITAGRWINTARGTADLLRLMPEDKFYTCLPLYHGAGQGLCILPVIYAGASVRVGRKFSRKYTWRARSTTRYLTTSSDRTFWPEVCESQANRLQYVGELCRYLVNAPPHPLERKHIVQEAWGNGMSKEITTLAFSGPQWHFITLTDISRAGRLEHFSTAFQHPCCTRALRGDGWDGLNVQPKPRRLL